MAAKIKFDSTHNVIPPTFVLATRSGRKLGAIPANSIVFKDSMNSYSEATFKVYKTDNGVEYSLWDTLKDLKLMYCPDWDLWFELKVELDESNELIKNVTARSLGEAELSQVNLYGVEINTENDIARKTYVPTVLYNAENPDGSLLHRITQKVPHYRIDHVDDSIAGIQRSFTFDGKSIYDAFQEIAEEINCLFVLDSHSNSNGGIDRAISVYDLESHCNACGKRSEFIDVCPTCGSTDFTPGYGEDTTIFVSTENLAENITYATDVDSVKNCFHLEAGDDLMTATVINCDPSGSGYIWYISDEQKEDMSPELRDKLTEYDEEHAEIQNNRLFLGDANDYIDQEDEYEEEFGVNIEAWYEWTSLVAKYGKQGIPLEVPHKIIGYSNLMSLYYDAIDAKLFLENKMMPNVVIESTSLDDQVENLKKLRRVDVLELDNCSYSTVSNTVLSMAKALVDPRYQVKLATTEDDKIAWETSDSGASRRNWSGGFTVTNYSDETKTATIRLEIVYVYEDYSNFVKQKVDLMLARESSEVTDISGLFKLEGDAFKNELHKYCLNRLTAFYDVCQGCIDILIEQGISEATVDGTNDLYNSIYLPYKNKLQMIQDEISIRESEISILTDEEKGLIPWLERTISSIQDKLDFEAFIGEDLWLEFAAYRREDSYKNENYISDGLSNDELFENASAFIETAKKEIIKSATLQHSITATLKNLLVMKEFFPIVDHFATGNWIRIEVDGKICRLRLIDYEIQYDDLKSLPITFSDIQTVASGASDIKSILSQSVSMATSYGAVTRQARNGQQVSKQVNEWLDNGFDAAQTKVTNSSESEDYVLNKSGIVFRKYDPDSGTYDPVQLKIVNAVMSMTEDDWKTNQKIIGEIPYKFSGDANYRKSCGVNGAAVVGRMLIGSNTNLNAYYIDDGTEYDLVAELKSLKKAVESIRNGLGI